MAWNWEHSDWPNFRWDSAALAELEAQFLHRSGMQIGSIKHFDQDTRLSIMVDMLTGEALKTSEIEGEILNRDSVQSSILMHFGLKADNRRVPPAERGISDMMVDLYLHFAQDLNHDALHKWHRMITNGRSDLRDIGAYRTHEDPMQVVSDALHKPKVHFEAPPSRETMRQMDAFLAWFAATGSGGATPVPALTRSGLAHLYFVCIHPYEDGNGRIARALAEKSLAQAIGQPSLIALSHAIQRKRHDYYDALEANNKGIEITPWLEYFARTVLDAQDYTQRIIDFLIEKAKLYDRVRDTLNERQRRAIERMFREGPEGFTGGLSAANYVRITGASRATATRDLQGLVDMGALRQTGTMKSTRYWLATEVSARPERIGATAFRMGTRRAYVVALQAADVEEIGALLKLARSKGSLTLIKTAHQDQRHQYHRLHRNTLPASASRQTPTAGRIKLSARHRARTRWLDHRQR